MKVLKILFYILLTAVVLALVLGLFARHNYHLERSIEIDAPRAVVFDQIRYFKNFEKWSPWSQLDPNMKKAIEGTDGEVGAVYRWEGNSDARTGFQTIKSITPERINIDITIQKPWQSVSPTYFILTENGEKTKVLWGFDIHIGFPWNAMAMFTDVDAGMGKDFARGLGTLKKVCEQIVHPKYRGYDVVESEAAKQYYIGRRDTIPQAEVTSFLADHFLQILAALKNEAIDVHGKSASLTYLWEDSTKTADIAAVIAMEEPKKLTGFEMFTIGGSKALTIEYYGLYDSIGPAHLAMGDYIKEKGLQMIPPAVEEYVTDTAAEPDTMKWLTKVIYFVKLKQEPEE